MNKISANTIYNKAIETNELYDAGKMQEAMALALEAENETASIEDEAERAIAQQYIAGCLIDIGSYTGNLAAIQSGTQYYQTWVDEFCEDESLVVSYYNLANGYIAQAQLSEMSTIGKGKDSENHRRARHYYRQAIKKINISDISPKLACEIWTNYGQILYSISRPIEALSAFDEALRINPNMGMALFNKADVLLHLAPLTSGHTHLFYLEAKRLLELAAKQEVSYPVREMLPKQIEKLEKFLELHGEMRPESLVRVKPESDFHKFLCDFCARHNLFLSPATALGNQSEPFYGDTLFISKMYAEAKDIHKFDRYITFLNEIKQDYVIGRYCLVQSQFASNVIDAVDMGVELCYPFDYSLYSSYIHLLKMAIKQAIAVLDKVAYFIFDYCKLNHKDPDRIDFRSLFDGADTVPKVFDNFKSPHLFAIFTVAQDVSRKGDWSIIYDHRNALTHRFLVLHDIIPEAQANSDIPRIPYSDFLNQTILAFQVARAVIVYLIQFVEHMEEVDGADQSRHHRTVHAVPIRDGLRHRPSSN